MEDEIEYDTEEYLEEDGKFFTALKPINICWIITGSQPYEQLCIASYCRQFSTNN